MEITVKEETNRIEPEKTKGMNHKILIQVGAGILMIYFILFGFNTLTTVFNNTLYYQINGTYNDQFVAVKQLILSVMSVSLLNLGFYFFIRGLRKLKKSKGKTQDRKLQTFIAFYVFFMVTMILIDILDTVAFLYYAYKGTIPYNAEWKIGFITYFGSFVLFGLVIMMIGIQTNILRKRNLIDTDVVKRPVVHFLMVGIFIIWIFFMININAGIMSDFNASFIGYLSSQIATSVLAAGVYLELVIKVEKSKQEINMKS